MGTPIDHKWASSPDIAAYVWEALNANGTLLEYSEWNENFDHETPLATIGDGVERVIGGDPNKTIWTWKLRKEHRMRARPLRDNLPTLEIPVPAGCELIYLHRHCKTIGIGPAGEILGEINFKTLLFGRIFPDTFKMDLMQVWPNGEHREHASLEEAYSII